MKVIMNQTGERLVKLYLHASLPLSVGYLI